MKANLPGEQSSDICTEENPAYSVHLCNLIFFQFPYFHRANAVAYQKFEPYMQSSNGHKCSLWHSCDSTPIAGKLASSSAKQSN